MCWAMESGVSYGLVCIERDKISLEAIDLDLVRFISRCIAHLCAVEKQQIKTVSGDQILEMLLSGKINSPVGLSSAAGDTCFICKKVYIIIICVDNFFKGFTSR